MNSYMRDMQREMDTMLDAFGSSELLMDFMRPAAGLTSASALRLPFDIHETDSSYELVAEVGVLMCCCVWACACG
jgi:HSP20 family molecular chaperone IbpA